jgi:cyclopropane-fatty-acyl-phospholipid synthase
VIRDASGTTRFGDAAGQSVRIDVTNARFYWAAVTNGAIGVAESYLKGDWNCDDLTALFRLFLRNQSTSNEISRGIARWTAVLHSWLHTLRRNSVGGSRRNIQKHYDLGNEFFRLWLDDSLAYSSGIFPTPGSTLAEASAEKFDRICRKLDLQPSDHLLEIGTGWGGFAIHAAKEYGCRVTTTTISHEQWILADERVRDAGLQRQITLVEQDYRALKGQYDKLASIEMIEAVGHRYLDTFFGQCGRLLRPKGTFVLQGILMPDRGYDTYLRSVDFIQQYVFPGGCLPSLGSIVGALSRSSTLRFVHAEEFAGHYAKTLRSWRNAFQDQLAAVRRLRYPERFIRLWNYYLCYCEAAFEERYIAVMQLQFDGDACRRDAIQISSKAAHQQTSVLELT